MRSTSSSAARQLTGIPIPAGVTSTRRSSIEHNNAARLINRRGQPGDLRQSLQARSLSTQPETDSDLPFRRIYRSAKDSGEDEIKSRLPPLTDSPEPDLTREMISEPDLDNQPGVHFEEQRTPTQRDIQHGGKHINPTGFDFYDQQTPTQRNIQRESEYAATPTQRTVGSGIKVDAPARSGRDYEGFRRLPDSGNTMDQTASLSDVQRGKQPVRMATGDMDRPEDEAIAKRQEIPESGEEGTIMHIRLGDEARADEKLHYVSQYFNLTRSLHPPSHPFTP